MLPVYDAWEFDTGPGGEFEQLVRRLGPARLDQITDPAGNPLVGTRPMSLSAPGFGLADDPGRPDAALSGALRLAGTTTQAPDGLPLLDAVNLADEVAPPVYGRWHAAAPVGGADPVWPPWLAQLNLDPGLRVAAGMGAAVVRARQEEFMAAAWQQVGEIRAANQVLRQAELALAGSQRIYQRHVATLPDLRLLEFAAPALSRLRSTADPSRTLTGVIGGYCLPEVCLTGGWVRLLRRRGPLVRRLERAKDGARFDPTLVIQRLADGDREPVRDPPGPIALAGATELAEVLTRPGRIGIDQVEREALGAMLTTLAARAVVDPCLPTSIGQLATDARARLLPSATIPRRVNAQLRLPPGMRAPDRIDPIMAAPQITAPTAGFLAEQGQDWLLPGLQHVPKESVSAVVANQRFVEAFLAGMNHEICRELLWRGYPTDQRGTVFRHFFDAQAAAMPSPGDITVMHGWSGDLGSHPARSGPADRFVLVVRGELLRRFPHTTVLLVKGLSSGGTRKPGPVDEAALLPVFAGRLEPDVTFLGFDVSAEAARSDPGYYVVFQEQPTEPCFGVGAVSGQLTGGRYGSWADLGRGDLAVTGGGYVRLEATTSTAFLDRVPTDSTVWDGRSDSLAAILLRRPFRLYLHGSDIVPRTSS
ncbi:hypothetical protein [Streptomyces sp. NBC_01538]|uniref:hypothetical protein n=1 Tax=Streptomyces sp. NBC_01538 TaxID=2903897 RepID=UPI00386F475D